MENKTIKNYGLVVYAGGQKLFAKQYDTKEKALEVYNNNHKYNVHFYECYTDGTCRIVEV